MLSARCFAKRSACGGRVSGPASSVTSTLAAGREAEMDSRHVARLVVGPAASEGLALEATSRGPVRLKMRPNESCPLLNAANPCGRLSQAPGWSLCLSHVLRTSTGLQHIILAVTPGGHYCRVRCLLRTASRDQASLHSIEWLRSTDAPSLARELKRLEKRQTDPSARDAIAKARALVQPASKQIPLRF